MAATLRRLLFRYAGGTVLRWNKLHPCAMQCVPVFNSVDRAVHINKTLQKIMPLEAEIQLRIRFDHLGYFDNTRLISDTLLLERAVQHAVNRFAGARITKILSPAADGIPLAALLVHRLGVKLIIAKKTREVGVREFIEEVYVPDKSAMVISLYLPRDALKRGDCVLIVDDVVDRDKQIPKGGQRISPNYWGSLYYSWRPIDLESKYLNCAKEPNRDTWSRQGLHLNTSDRKETQSKAQSSSCLDSSCTKPR